MINASSSHTPPLIGTDSASSAIHTFLLLNFSTTSRMKSFLSALVLAAFATKTLAQQCYSVDGQQLDSRYQPCYPDKASSACCMLNGTQGANQQNDICLDSGLCQATSGWYAGFLYINGCTDPTGKADGCAKICSFRKSTWHIRCSTPNTDSSRKPILLECTSVRTRKVLL